MNEWLTGAAIFAAGMIFGRITALISWKFSHRDLWYRVHFHARPHHRNNRGCQKTPGHED